MDALDREIEQLREKLLPLIPTFEEPTETDIRVFRAALKKHQRVVAQLKRHIADLRTGGESARTNV